LPSCCTGLGLGFLVGFLIGGHVCITFDFELFAVFPDFELFACLPDFDV
jgi:hypothetical protein